MPIVGIFNSVNKVPRGINIIKIRVDYILQKQNKELDEISNNSINGLF